MDFLLNGNSVFRLIQPTQEDILEMQRVRVSEVILTLNPITRMNTAKEIDDFIMAQSSSLPCT